MILENELLNTGKKDLSAAQTLYESQHYSNAIFMLQQCVEKCIKSYGILIKIIEEKDLSKKINHSAHKIFAREVKAKLDKLKVYKNTPILIPEMIPPHQRVESKENDEITLLESLYEKINFVNLTDFDKLEEEELRKFIISARIFKIKKIEDEEEILKHFKEDWVKTNEHFLSYFKEVFSGKNLEEMLESVKLSVKHSDYFAQNRLENFKYKIEKEQITNQLIFVWFNLSIMTTPHEQRSRYPSTLTNKGLDEVYNEEHILIKHFPELIYVMEKTIEEYERIYLPS